MPRTKMRRPDELHRRGGLAMVAAVVALIVASCTLPPPAHALDVDNPPKPVVGGLVTSNGWSQIQTFTAGRTGVLDQVNLFVQFTGPGDLQVAIHDVNGAYDLGVLLGSGTHNGSATGEVAVPLSIAPHIVAGHRYAIALRGTVPASQGSWQLSFSATVPLVGETMYVRYDNPPQDVFPNPSYNISLRTFVRPF